MKLSRRILAAPALALALASGACTDGLTEINQNPNEPEVVPAANLLGNAIMDAVGGLYGSHGVWTTLYMNDLWAQHMAQPQYNDEDEYVPRSAQLNGIWVSAYTGPLADLAKVKLMGTEANNANLVAVAEVLTQWQYLRLTDYYGDIPYSEALRSAEGITSPKYDPQAEVYAGILAKLTAAASSMQLNGSTLSFAAGDLLYGGDMELWKKFANSLRMRVAMRLVEADPAKARAEFIAAYQAGGFTSNDDNAFLQWTAQSPSQNPIMVHYKTRPLADHSLSKTLVDSLTRLNDPRLEVYADPALEDGEYRGLPNGVEPGELALGVNDFSFLGERFREPDAPSVIISYAEVLFLQAEAAARGWIAGNAEALYRAAVHASLDQHGVSQAAANTYVNGLPYNGLSSIYLQEWIALFMQGGEAWNLVRRTDAPALVPADDFASIPLRLPYSPDEQLYNPDNYVETDLFDPLWWDK